MRSAERGQVDCVQLLVDAGADKEVRTNVRVGRCFAEVQPLFVHFFSCSWSSLIFLDSPRSIYFYIRYHSPVIWQSCS
jgi:hypothetical protein